MFRILNEDVVESEISEYIVTEKLARHFSTLIDAYSKTQKETGVWLSGFYGSGKSYFAKIFGQLLENNAIKGTFFVDRFAGRIPGLDNASIFENSIRGLSKYKTKLVYLDIGKKGTDVKSGLSYTLFKSFLKSLGFSTDKFGYMEFYLYLDGEYDIFKEAVKKIKGNDWEEIRKNRMAVPKIVADVLKSSFPDKYSDDSLKVLEDRINHFNSDFLVEEIQKFLKLNKTDRIVFIMDEVSEAISLEKIDLLDLQAVSESLSSIGAGRVWTIACAQEKLDDVIRNSRVGENELSKVQDRFKIRIHLSSEEVNEVIEKRLLNKNTKGHTYLKDFYSKNDGIIAEMTNLQNSTVKTKTENVEEFISCYPFHKFQFTLMANFLFKVNRKAKSGGTERGMVIAFHGVMKSIKEKEAKSFVTAWQLNEQGQKNPDSDLMRKYDRASREYANKEFGFDGSHILKVINFLNESVEVDATIDNITKNLIWDISSYYELKPKVEEAIKVLENKNLIISKQGKFSISSDVEAKLLEDKGKKHIQTYQRKSYINTRLKELSFLGGFKIVTFKGNQFKISFENEDDDEILGAKGAFIKLGLSNILNIEIENKDEFIEKQKFSLQSKKKKVLIVPELTHFEKINTLVINILQYKEMEELYASDSDERVKTVITDFRKNRQEEEKTVILLLEKAYTNGIMVQGFNEKNITEDNYNTVINESLQEAISNTFTDLLPSSLDEEISKRVLKQHDSTKLKSLFSDPEFAFFDSSGNFVGSHLKVIEELTNFCSSYKEGSEIEQKYTAPPYGWTYGTINAALSVLMRAGNLKIKTDGAEIFDYKDDNERVIKVFENSTKFKKSVFRTITKNLDPIQKQQIVENLNKIKAKEIVEITYNTHTNDIALVDVLKKVMSKQHTKYQDIKDRIGAFVELEKKVTPEIMILSEFNLAIDDSNFKDVAQKYLSDVDKYNKAVDLVRDLDDFCEEKLEKLKQMMGFVSNAKKQFEKAGISSTEIDALSKKWDENIRSDPSENYLLLNEVHQNILTEYFNANKDTHIQVTEQYNEITKLSGDLIKEAEKKSKKLNGEIICKAQAILQEADKNICSDLKITSQVECDKCGRTLSEVLMKKDLAPGREKELKELRFKIRDDSKKEEPPIIDIVRFPTRELSIESYKAFLMKELERIEKIKDKLTKFIIQKED